MEGASGFNMESGIMFEKDGVTGSPGIFSSLLEPFPFRWNRNGGSTSLFDAFSSREPVSTSLENALAIGSVTRNNSSLVSTVCPAFDFGR
jgi:hypothetical protein